MTRFPNHLLLLFALGILFGSIARAAEPPKPNVLLILTDDAGWGEFSCYNPESKLRTPHVDRLAREGMRFTHAHSPAALCSPTRYSILTGNYAWRGRTPNGTWGFDKPGQILTGQQTVAQLLKQAGYRSALIGKLGIGGEHAKLPDGLPDFSRPMLDGPRSWGFDFSAIIPRGHQAPPLLFLVNELPEVGAKNLVLLPKKTPRPQATDFAEPDWNHAKVGERLLGHARRFLDEHLREAKGTPFYLHFCADGAHSPWEPAETLAGRKLRGESGMTAHTDMVLETDLLLAGLMDLLEERGLLDDTLICFTSDNGGIPEERQLGHDATGGLRGKKGYIFEGGHRVPLLVRWPGKIPAGAVRHQPVGIHDLVATALELAGVPIPEDQCLDSVSLAPVLLGQRADSQPVRTHLLVDSALGKDAFDDGDPASRRARPKPAKKHHGTLNYTPEELAMSSHGMAHALYEGAWKLVFDIADLPAALYDLAADPAEKTNLLSAPEQAVRITRMTEAYRTIRTTPRSAPFDVAAAPPWWHDIFSLAFDGHGNFVAPHLGTLNATVASLGAAGFHGPWDADLNRDMPWMRGHEKAFAAHPGVKRLVYIEGAGATKVLARVAADGRVLFTESVLDGLDQPQRRRYVENLIKPDGRTVWLGDWQFMQGQEWKTPLGQPMPTARDLGLPPFTHPLTGAMIADEAEFWRTRSARPLIGKSSDGIAGYRAIPGDLAAKLDLASVTAQDPEGRWLVKSGESMLYDAPFAAYQAAKAARALEALAPDMIHYDDWDLRSPTLMNANADIHVAAFRRYVTTRLSEERCREIFGVERGRIAGFDVTHYLLNPPWRSEYDGKGTTPDGPAWLAATDQRWLGDKVWRIFQIACIEDRLSSMKEVYRLNQAARPLGRQVPMVANIIPTLSATFLQRDCVDMANFEWPSFKTYGAFPNPFGDYPRARLGLGPRMAAKIGTTGHAMVDPYVKLEQSGWDGKGFTRRHGETLHKVIAFDLLANRGIPAFALTWDGGFSPGSVHSAAQIHAFINEVSPVISRREFVADIGLAASSWSVIAAQTPFGGWNHEVSKRHLAEFVGWAQHLMTAPDFPQWDVLPLDEAQAADLTRFRLVILPSVIVLTADQFAALEAYLTQGGKLLITGESGTFTGPQMLLQPRPQSLAVALAKQFPQQVVLTTGNPGLQQHLDPTKAAAATNWRKKAFSSKPVLTVTGAPEHVTIQLNESRTRRGEFTLDLVNHHHDLPSDSLTPVTANDFQVHLRLPGLKDTPEVEVIRYDETAPHNTRREPLPPAAITFSAGSLTLRVPPFTHYEIVRIAPAIP